MNKGLKNISNEDLWKISINSIKNEKIRKVELLNHIDEIKVQDENINIIMKSIYQKMGFKKLEEFKDYLKINNVDYNFLKDKVEIESLWNELIYDKYFDKVFIDKESLLKKIKNDNNKKLNHIFYLKLFLISQIIYLWIKNLS